MTNNEWLDILSDLDLNVFTYDTKTRQSYGISFSDPKDIPSNELYLFFCYMTQGDEYPEDYCLRWYNEKEQEFHVPVSDVKEVLNKYFEDVNFNPEKIPAYNAKTDCIDDYWEDAVGEHGVGYDGVLLYYVNAELIKRERLSYDTVRLTVRFYDFDDFSVVYTKAYTIKFTDDGYKYISIVKV